MSFDMDQKEEFIKQEAQSDTVGVFTDNYKISSYQLFIKQGILHNHREMVHFKGPFRCLLCGDESFQKQILMNWANEHPGMFKQFRVLVGSELRLLGCYNLFKFLAVCPDNDCGTCAPQCNFVMGNNRYDTNMYWDIRLHWNREHGEEVNECSDADKLKIIYLEADEESVCSENSDLLDPDMMYSGPYECVRQL